jgi:hypothetical protein
MSGVGARRVQRRLVDDVAGRNGLREFGRTHVDAAVDRTSLLP